MATPLPFTVAPTARPTIAPQPQTRSALMAHLLEQSTPDDMIARPPHSIGEGFARTAGMGLDALMAKKVIGAQQDEVSRQNRLKASILAGEDPSKIDYFLPMVEAGVVPESAYAKAAGFGGAPEMPPIHMIKGPNGREIAAIWVGDNQDYGLGHPGFKPLGSEETDVLSPEAEAQKIKLAEAGSTKISNNVGPTGIDYGNPGDGLAWRRNPDGTVMTDDQGLPIAGPYQGGKVDAANKAAEAAGNVKTRQDQITGDIVLDDVRRARDFANENPIMTSGIAAGLQKATGLEGTPADQFSRKLTAVKSALTLGKLSEMRAASTNGASGLGAVTAPELALLEGVYGSLEASQSHEDIIYNLDRLERIYNWVVYRNLPDGSVDTSGKAAPPPEVVYGPKGGPPQQGGGGPSINADDIPVMATPEDAMKLKPGTPFRTPDGRLKVR